MDDWTLFLDRDGVINKNIDGGYVLKWEDFEFYPGFLNSIKSLSEHFKYIIVITNQQCIGKGLLSHDELAEIHQQMKEVIQLNGGRIDAIYYAPDLKSATNLLRKPNIGMPLLAKNHFPDIDFRQSIILGDKDSDIELGRKLEMKTVWMKNDLYFSSKADYTISSFEELLEIKF
ncbi:MAG: HAD-IIIA family hydrolase [Chitinophagales bacterium]|nr:HAD-IIIA family hydrolase [Chitinophagales bacterium]